VGDDVVCGLLDILAILTIDRRVLLSQLPGEHNREGHLVELHVLPALGAVDVGVLRERAIGLLLRLEEIVKCTLGLDLVARREQRSRDLIQVTRPHQVVRTRGVIGSPAIENISS